MGAAIHPTIFISGDIEQPSVRYNSASLVLDPNDAGMTFITAKNCSSFLGRKV